MLDYLHILLATLFCISALYKLYVGQAEHFYSRAIVAVWFTMSVVFRDYLDIRWARELSDYVLITIPITEIVSPMFMKYWKNKK